MSIRLIAIDIDGTLMPSSGLRVSPRNCEALRAAEAAGIEIVIATGRREAYAMPLISQVGLNENSVMVSSNGAVIRRFDGNLIARQFLQAHLARRLCSELREYGTLVFTFDRSGAGSLVIESLKQLRGLIERWVEANRPFLTEVCPLERAFDGDELPIQSMVCGDVEQMRQAEEKLRARGLGHLISMHRTEYPRRSLSILDLLPFGCSKGAALHRLAQLWNLRREEVMAVGDNLNDIEMLEYAGRSVVMANGSEEMLAMAQQRGWEITASNDQDGVALAVESAVREAAQAAAPDSNPDQAESEDTILEWAP